MAPTSNDPNELLIVLNAARRRALYSLVEDITAYMCRQFETENREGAWMAEPRSATSGSLTADHDDDWDDDGISSKAGAVATNLGRESFTSNRPIPEPAPDPMASAKLAALRRDALQKMREWRSEVLARLKDAIMRPDDQKILEERRKRLETAKTEGSSGGTKNTSGRLFETSNAGGGVANPIIGSDDDSGKPDPADDIPGLQALYPPLPTRLSGIPQSDRISTLSSVLLVLLSSGAYPAQSRVLLLHLVSSLLLPLSVLLREETEVAHALIEVSDKASSMTTETEAADRRRQNKTARFWKVGLASVAGAAVIGITGGLAAPVVAGALGGVLGGIGLGGVASFLGVFWMNGALVGTLFGAFGAKMTGEMMDKYAREVEDFKLLTLNDDFAASKSSHRLRITIGINGWLMSPESIADPWRPLASSSAEVFALRYEVSALMSLGKTLSDFASSYAWGFARNEILRRTVLASVWGALWPAALLSSAASVLDNPFAHALNRSRRAGRILADALANRVQGERPVTLVGFSLGAAVVTACLEELANRRIFGVVESVVLVGAPAGTGRDYWKGLSTVVAGRLFNVYSENDYILGFLYRANGLKFGIAGLQPIRGVTGVVNVDLSSEVNGHLRYPELLNKVLTRCGFPSVKGGVAPIDTDPGLADLNNVHEEGLQRAPSSLEAEAVKKKNARRFPEELGEAGLTPAMLAEKRSYDDDASKLRTGTIARQGWRSEAITTNSMERQNEPLLDEQVDRFVARLERTSSKGPLDSTTAAATTTTTTTTMGPTRPSARVLKGNDDTTKAASTGNLHERNLTKKKNAIYEGFMPQRLKRNPTEPVFVSSFGQGGYEHHEDYEDEDKDGLGTIRMVDNEH